MKISKARREALAAAERQRDNPPGEPSHYRKGNMPEVNAYIRVSTDKQEEGQQRQIIGEWSRAKGINVGHYYTDTASGGISWRERALADALGNAAKGDTIVVSEVSRIARSTLGVLSFIQEARARGVCVISISDGVTADDTIAGEIMATMLAMAAQIERTLLRQRTRAALRQRVAEGIKLGRPVGSTRPSKLAGRASEIQELLAAKVSKRAIARVLQCSPQTLHKFLNGETAEDTQTLPLPLGDGTNAAVH